MLDRLQQILFRRRAYRRCFLGDDGQLTKDAEVVMADLVRFCRYNRSITIVSPVSRQTDVPASFQAEGRREALTRILAHLHVNDADLIRITEREAIHD